MPTADSIPNEDIVELDAASTGDEVTPDAKPDPAQEAPKTEAPDLNALKAQWQGELLDQLRQQNMLAVPPQRQEPTKPKDEFEEIGELVLSDQTEFTRRVYAKALADAERNVMAQVAPLISRARSADVVDMVAGDMSPETKEYVRKFASDIDPATLKGEALNLVQRAARDFERETREKADRPKVEAAHGESTRVSVDRQAYDEYNAMRTALGLGKATAGEFAAAQKEPAHASR